jgi:hypothetical protein
MSPGSPRSFRYLFDPLCVTAIVLFAVNRFALKPLGVAEPFVFGYVNDLLCLPIFLPISLGLQRLMRVRRHDDPPRLWETLQHAAIFSVVFEVVLPRFPAYFVSRADPLDVVAYFVGGLFAWAWWRWRANRR